MASMASVATAMSMTPSLVPTMQCADGYEVSCHACFTCVVVDMRIECSLSCEPTHSITEPLALPSLHSSNVINKPDVSMATLQVGRLSLLCLRHRALLKYFPGRQVQQRVYVDKEVHAVPGIALQHPNWAGGVCRM